MSSVESRIADLSTHVSSIMSPGSPVQAPPVSVPQSPFLNSVTQHCQESFPSPLPFDSTTSWSAYCMQFESVAALHSWSPHHKAQILVAQIRSAAAEFLEFLPASNRSTRQVSSRHSSPPMVMPIFNAYILQNYSRCNRATVACKSSLLMSSACPGRRCLVV
ncbi:hypothetical protein HPB49_014290 [Dermacentor silvarum]|uniref:Uncharacterized protein n=1 Tax=Dermacentor silvarum TaxID=543639 RepID=A0ACB8DPS8_DERSI|nr:hypothetical protein HPB49_014290 [Dermacentor silvarum]